MKIFIIAFLFIFVNILPVYSFSPIKTPERLAIYYGYPSLINNANGDINKAISEFSYFETIILGDSLEHPSHNDHNNTKKIINGLVSQGKQIFGYVDMGITTQNIPIATAKKYAEEWKDIGATGIFWDDAGDDYGVNYERRRDLVKITHDLGMSAFLNAWYPDDIILDPTLYLNFNDYLLIESWLVSDGVLENLNLWSGRADKYFNFSKKTGVKLGAISTGGTNGDLSAPTHPYQISWWGATMYNLDAYGYTNIQYSSYGEESNRLRRLGQPLPNDYGNYFLTENIKHLSNDLHERETDMGRIIIEDQSQIMGYFDDGEPSISPTTTQATPIPNPLCDNKCYDDNKYPGNFYAKCDFNLGRCQAVGCLYCVDCGTGINPDNFCPGVIPIQPIFKSGWNHLLINDLFSASIPTDCTIFSTKENKWESCISLYNICLNDGQSLISVLCD